MMMIMTKQSFINDYDDDDDDTDMLTKIILTMMITKTMTMKMMHSAGDALIQSILSF